MFVCVCVCVLFKYLQKHPDTGASELFKSLLFMYGIDIMIKKQYRSGHYSRHSIITMGRHKQGDDSSGKTHPLQNVDTITDGWM